MSEVFGKGPVFRLDRREKAKMIGAVISAEIAGGPSDADLLDIGCGNGDISRWFVERGNRVSGVDIEDKRRGDVDGFEFHLVTDESLPFDDDRFDVVLSHHVIEHVNDQSAHLSEMRRVLRPDGLGYLATPNRTSPIMQGHVGNDAVLRYREMEPLLRAAGFEVREMSVDIVKDARRFHSEYPGLSMVPRAVLRLARPLFPSHVFLLRPS